MPVREHNSFEDLQPMEKQLEADGKVQVRYSMSDGYLDRHRSRILDYFHLHVQELEYVIEKQDRDFH